VRPSGQDASREVRHPYDTAAAKARMISIGSRVLNDVLLTLVGIARHRSAFPPVTAARRGM
jgi:hypothetical protein